MDSDDRKKSKEWILFIRQLLVSSGVWTNYFMFGLAIGAPTVFIPQLRRDNNTTIDINMESWLSSASAFSAIPSVFALSFFCYAIGRAWTLRLVTIFAFVSFIILYFSANIVNILIGQVFQGPLAGAQVTVCFMMTAEFTSPKYRGTFLTIQTATMFWGIWVANAIGTFFNWKGIALLGICCCIYSLSVSIIWPESPFWLSIKGKVEECQKAHRWLKGTGEESEKELECIIKTSDEYGVKSSSLFYAGKHVRNFLESLMLPEVYKPLLLSLLSVSLFHLTGKVVCTMYSIKIIKKITASESWAYSGMLILDGVTVFGMYCGCIFVKHFKRRNLLIVTCSIVILFLCTTSLYLYLIKLSVIDENKYVSLALLTGFSLTISVGPMILSVTLNGELLPLKCRNSCICIIGLTAKILMSVNLKVSPYLFKYLELHGTFLFFAISCTVCVLVAYKYLPETKDRTLSEIEDFFKGPQKTVEEAKELMTNKENYELENGLQ